MIKIGIDESFRNEHSYSIFTLETHLCYLAEADQGEKLDIDLQLQIFRTRKPTQIVSPSLDME